MKMVGYNEKRQKTDLDQELEASLDGKQENGGVTNKSDAHYGKPRLNQKIQQREELELFERDKGIASDFDGNFIGDFGTASKQKERKIYS